MLLSDVVQLLSVCSQMSKTSTSWDSLKNAEESALWQSRPFLLDLKIIVKFENNPCETILQILRAPIPVYALLSNTMLWTPQNWLSRPYNHLLILVILDGSPIFFFPFPRHRACGKLVPQPGIEP